MTSSCTLLLVDGFSYLFRAYHALPKLTNSRHEPTGALVGMLHMLRRLLDDCAPRQVAVVFDAGGETFRDRLYPAYKANRPPMPEDLRAQIAPLQEIVGALGLPWLAVPGVEADDVLATLARRASARGLTTQIATGDKDLAQLVGDRITLIDTMKDTRLDRAGVIAKFGVPPERVVDYLSLVGDRADHIPGVPKCGPKTAVGWLQRFGDLDAILEQAGQIRGQVGESLRACRDQLLLSRELVTLKTDVALDLDLEDLVPSPPEVATLRAWYTRLESRRLLESLGEPETPPAPKPVYEIVLTWEAFAVWEKRLKEARLLALDTETTSLDAMQARIVGVSFCVAPRQAAYVPLAHRYLGVPEQLDREAVLARLKPLLEDPHTPKVGQNLKYDKQVLANHGIDLRGIAHDTLLEAYVLDSAAPRQDLDTLARKYLHRETTRFTAIAGTGAGQLRFDAIPLDQAGPYAAEDAEVALCLHRELWPRLEAEAGLARLYRELEIPLIPVLSRMERRGVRLDVAQLAAQSRDLGARLAVLEQQAQAEAGHAFNLGSPKQIGEILFQEQKLPPVARTPKGAPSTAESVLHELAEAGHALPRLILEHRTLAKLKSTYTDKLPRLVHPDTGRVHTSYHQAVTATGRLSSSDPNLQNIPIRSEDGRRIRRAFIPDPGFLLVAADYSQIELRILAHLSGDAGLRAAFASGQDVHRATAAEVWDLDPEQVTGDQRRAAKAINFGLIYGMSAFGLARQLGIERSAAQEYIDRYFRRYPGVAEFLAELRARARDQKYVETLFGRRLYVPDIDHANQTRRAAAERTAINAPMQGTAADLIKRAMLAVDAWIETERPPVRLLLQVHDELVFEGQAAVVEEACERIRSAMEQAACLDVPLEVEIGVGENWEEAH